MVDVLPEQISLIAEEVAFGTGADIEITETCDGLQSGLCIWFADLTRTRSPVVEIRPSGLSRHRVTLSFGNFARPTIEAMRDAGEEEVQLARALISSLKLSATVKITPGHRTFDDWSVSDENFSIEAERSGITDRLAGFEITQTCRAIVTPMLGAMAELYGYEFVNEGADDNAGFLEGAVLQSVVKRRERNPRNRLLCLRLHGSICVVCKQDTSLMYGSAIDVIEVHHLQPLSQQGEPRIYDPKTDLVPVCPNCHRAIHSRRPVPWLPAEIQQKMEEVIDK